MKTLHIPIKKKSVIIHVATVRSDWQHGDWEYLSKMFPGAYIQTTRETLPLWWLAIEPPKCIEREWI